MFRRKGCNPFVPAEWSFSDRSGARPHARRQIRFSPKKPVQFSEEVTVGGVARRGTCETLARGCTRRGRARTRLTRQLRPARSTSPTRRSRPRPVQSFSRPLLPDETSNLKTGTQSPRLREHRLYVQQRLAICVAAGLKRRPAEPRTQLARGIGCLSADRRNVGVTSSATSRPSSSGAAISDASGSRALTQVSGW